ncbi:GMC oxidoreductase [Leptodontidium sp. MPI-SDFR-AT-0119]|nr:GMC oxidoreductase [Leptodontidium sp. MPI-SDFR-AT-0119]
MKGLKIQQDTRSGRIVCYPIGATLAPSLRDEVRRNVYDYIVVGSGPGGAPLASRLGLAGYKVLVIEAGSDATPTDWNITVPFFNALAAEDPRISWDFYVNHFPQQADNEKDPKYNYVLPDGTLYTGHSPPAGATPKGFLYPRSSAVGGCVNHNALIMMYPLAAEWSELVDITGDSSWNAAQMRKYFQKIEDCQYLSPGAAGHGFSGWLRTNRADESIFLGDTQVVQILQAGLNVSEQTVKPGRNLNDSLARDLNAFEDYETHQGLFNTPLNIDHYKRSSPRDFLINTAQYLSTYGGSGRIDIRTECLATRVLFKPKTTHAIGVEFMDGQSLYRADPRAQNAFHGVIGIALAKKEVIISAGTFNTPQLLKLSGIGPIEELHRENMQDRYENSVIVNLTNPFTVSKGCTRGATASDPCLLDWNSIQSNKTKYATNGRAVSVPIRSSGALAAANDMVIAGRPGYFTGYFPGYSKIGSKFPNSWSWPTLKARTQNRAGNVRLVTSDPRDVPSINFNYYDSGSGNWSYDLAATVGAMQFARSIVKQYERDTNQTATELVPGPGYETEAKLTEWVRSTSFGHHACCTAKIGADSDPMAVLDSKFRVRGTQGLRVVDASVFPSIPGYYIQTPIYMISEKAAAVIIGS